MRKTKIGQNGITEELSEEEQETINEALYYAVRENHNMKIDKNKTKIMREALNIMKQQKEKPFTSHMCSRSVNDFFTSCVERGWEDELKEIEWLEVGE
jgi:hypothetical protein